MTLWLSILAGLAMLAAGGDLLVRGASSAARRLGVSPLLIGLTLVGFGTSTPELVTSLQAAFAGSPGIAVGNVVGSNISNSLLILGVTALVAPLAVNRRAFRRDSLILIVATGGLVWATTTGFLTREMGFAGIGALAMYILLVWLMERKQPDAEGERIEDEAEGPSKAAANLWLALPMAAAGIGITIYGANLLVGGAIQLARGLGVSDTLVGLTIVAIGTSLPELVTSAMAAARKQGEVALGNILGSNLYNILGILGITAAIKPIAVPGDIAKVDIWVLAAATALMILLARRLGKVTRAEGLLLVLAYAAYIAWLVWSSGL
ncbi:MAG TPA: calcium/sodium antiporter [Caulobacter sp.]|nr:calcium/sodium antiporter [Caulobacter sp.]